MSDITQSIIDPVDKALILKELTEDKLLKPTINGSNFLYVVTAHNSPAIMEEIGRLRELSFREAGGGTGLSFDIDSEDRAEGGYQQLIVWNPDDLEIIGGYRFIVSSTTHPEHMSTEHYFGFTDKFREEYLPYMIELGRSFVQPKYQGRKGGAKSLYALDNLWDGLGALTVVNSHVKYFFGKVTMYPTYDVEARNILIYFLKKYFKDSESLLTPINPIEIKMDVKAMETLFCGDSYSEDYKILSKEVRSRGENIPPLINSYMNLSPSMKVFDTVTNPDFGDVEETGILITINDIHQNKLDRYVNAYTSTISR